MERITDRVIKSKVEMMQRAGMDVDLDGQYGKFRVCNKAGSRHLSPRASNREIYDWLDAYQQGWAAGHNHGR